MKNGSREIFKDAGDTIKCVCKHDSSDNLISPRYSKHRDSTSAVKLLKLKCQLGKSSIPSTTKN